MTFDVGVPAESAIPSTRPGMDTILTCRYSSDQSILELAGCQKFSTG